MCLLSFLSVFLTVSAVLQILQWLIAQPVTGQLVSPVWQNGLVLHPIVPRDVQLLVLHVLIWMLLRVRSVKTKRATRLFAFLLVSVTKTIMSSNIAAGAMETCA